MTECSTAAQSLCIIPFSDHRSITSSRMFSFRNGQAAVLLLLLIQSLVSATSGDENIQAEELAKAIISSNEIPWIKRIDPLIRASETSCAEDIAAMSEAFMAQETWAMQMVDASSKIQSGILKGNVRDLGMYDECIKAKGQYNGTDVQGQYCTVSYSFLSSAVCVPSSCNETEVAELLNSIIQNVSVITELGFQINRVSCLQVGPKDFTLEEIVTISFFALVGFFMILCTICELVKKCKPGDVSPVVNGLAKFSLYTNAMALLNTEVSPRMMPAIQGIRFLSTCWVVLGHHYTTSVTVPLINSSDITGWFSTWTALYVQVAPFAVDTFFVISGFLTSYLFLKSKQSGKKFNFPMMYFHRYIRLTPCLAVVMLFIAVLLHRVASGPIWNTAMATSIESCRKNWWINLLYVQNFVRRTEMCVIQSWYLAVDMQLFWISPIILYPLHRWPKWGFRLLCVFLAASVVTPTVLLIMNEYSNAIVRFSGPADKTMRSFYYFYIPTYTRACAYFVGMLLGYDVANRKRHLSKLMVAINWVMAGIFMLVCGLATKRIYNVTLEYSLVLETVFTIILRPFWSIAIAWIVYACTFGYGGPVTRFLSLPIYLPLCRLSYCMYLVHVSIQTAKGAALHTPGRFTDFLWFNEYWSDIVLSIVVAFILSLFFESPVIVLEKMLTNRGRIQSPVRESKTDVEGGIENKETMKN